MSYEGTFLERKEFGAWWSMHTSAIETDAASNPGLPMDRYSIRIRIEQQEQELQAILRAEVGEDDDD